MIRRVARRRPPPRKRHRVAVRRRHVAYQWQSAGQALARGFKLALFLGSAVGLAWAGQWGLRRVEWLRVRSVHMGAGVPADVARQISIRSGDSLLGFSSSRMEAALLADHPELAEVRIRRRWDRTVRVDVRRRRPLAKILSGERWLGIDDGGRAFALDPQEPLDALTTLVAPPGAARAGLGFLKALKATGAPWTENLYKVRLTAEEEAELYLRNETQIVWGPVTWEEDRLKLRAGRLERLFRQPSLANGVASVRFVSDERLAVTPRPNINSGD